MICEFVNSRSYELGKSGFTLGQKRVWTFHRPNKPGLIWTLVAWPSEEAA